MNNGNQNSRSGDRQKNVQGRVPVKKFEKKKKKSPLPLIFAILVSAIVLAAFTLALLTAAGTIDLFKGGETEAPHSEPKQTDAPETSAPETEENTEAGGVKYKFLTMTPDDIGKGNLVLINAEHGVSVPKKESLVNIYSYRAGDYGMSSTETLFLYKDAIDALDRMMFAFSEADPNIDDVEISQAFRTYEEQESYYKAGKSKTEPGHTEYHSGNSLSIRVYRPGKGIYSIDDVGGDYLWFGRNCQKFGFVQRYPSHKSEITGFSNENWLLRYVGVPHALYMNENDLCLEEYLEDLKNNHSYSEEHATVTDDNGTVYELYYVGGSTSGQTKVPVPEDLPYTVSGDNVSGFVIAVEAGEKEQ